MGGQAAFMGYVEELIEQARGPNAPRERVAFKAPVIVVNGQVQNMISAVGLGCLLQIEKLKAEKERQLDLLPESAADIAPLRLDLNGKVTKESKAENKNVVSILNTLDDKTLREVACEIATETLNTVEVDHMSEAQQRIAATFDTTHWEWLVDDALHRKDQESGQSNIGLFTVVNPLKHVHSDEMMQQVNTLAIKKAELREKSKKMASRNQDADKSAEPSEKSACTLPMVRTSQFAQYAPKVYAFAGFLPAGRHKLFIYDR